MMITRRLPRDYIWQSAWLTNTVIAVSTAGTGYI